MDYANAEHLGSLEILHEGEDGNWVCRPENRANRQRKGPGPIIWQHAIDDKCCEIGAEYNTRTSQKASLLEGLKESVDVDLHHIAEDESR